MPSAWTNAHLFPGQAWGQRDGKGGKTVGREASYGASPVNCGGKKRKDSGTVKTEASSGEFRANGTCLWMGLGCGRVGQTALQWGESPLSLRGVPPGTAAGRGCPGQEEPWAGRRLWNRDAWRRLLSVRWVNSVEGLRFSGRQERAMGRSRDSGLRM